MLVALARSVASWDTRHFKEGLFIANELFSVYLAWLGQPLLALARLCTSIGMKISDVVTQLRGRHVPHWAIDPEERVEADQSHSVPYDDESPRETDPLLRLPRPRSFYLPMEKHSIRVLTIHAGSEDDPLCGDLREVNLLNRPKYDALSYTWADESGDARRTKQILCMNDESTIRVTKNCYTAMQKLRLLDKPRDVWIDAICIDQENDLERSYQVSLMSRIFTQAQNVIVYTGEGSPQTDQLFDWVNGLREQDLDVSLNLPFDDMTSKLLVRSHRMWKAGRTSLSALLGTSSTAAKSAPLAASEFEIADLASALFSQRWFTRIWVIQEVALPDVNRISILCGSRRTTARRALHLFSALRHSNSDRMVRIFVMLRRRKRFPTRSHLLDVLIETGSREAADPRDKIFGVLSIAHALDGGGFATPGASYLKSTPQVYTEYSEFFIQHHGPTFFLSLIKSSQRIQGLPSWAADWTAPWPNQRSVEGKEFPATQTNPNGKDSGAEFSYQDGFQTLKLVRPRIRAGYFTHDGHLDGVADVSCKDVAHLAPDHVLIEMHPGVAALLRRFQEFFVFICICPHALTEQGLCDLVARWSDAVADSEESEKISNDNAKHETSLSKHLDTPEMFQIR
ncbi:HET-domain-containing protein [Thozetella sp. PMI_491]|nr:HET-domain-containing protein [Thozetella sp. PMI_491]